MTSRQRETTGYNTIGGFYVEDLFEGEEFEYIDEDKKEKMQEELVEVVKKYDKDIEKQKEEAHKDTTTKKKAKPSGKSDIINVDVQNPDDRKTIYELMLEGKILRDNTGNSFILAEQNKKIYNPSNPAVHRIYCNTITRVTVRYYWLDLEIMPVGKRVLEEKHIWVSHGGHQSSSLISEEQLEYLLVNNYIEDRDIKYVHNDISTGGSYFLGNDSKEPAKFVLDQKEAQELKGYEATLTLSGDTPKEKEEVETFAEEVSEELVEAQ